MSKIIGNWCHRTITSTILKGLLGLLFAIGFLFISIYDKQISFIVLFSLSIIAVLYFTAVGIYRILKTNNNETPPIRIEDNTIFCYDGKTILELPIDNLYDISAKNKKYFHIFAGFISWGTYNYGTVKFYYYDGDKKRRFAIKNIYEPEEVVLALLNYLEELEII